MHSAPEKTIHVDALIIGAGMSGLAAGIRLGMYGKSVLLVERHSAPGGLNSYYNIGKRRFDVGLHAITNYSAPGEKGTPLTKIFRQLRIPQASFPELSPQNESWLLLNKNQSANKNETHEYKLTFNNTYAHFEAEVARAFPAHIDAYRACIHKLLEINDGDLALPPEVASASARAFLTQHISSPQLVNLLLMPVLYYGSAMPGDIELPRFAMLFKAIFKEGLCRPYAGIHPVLRTLLKRFKEVGGQRKMGCGVQQLITQGSDITLAILADGTQVHAKHIFSSAGLVETLRMCSGGKETQSSSAQHNHLTHNNIGEISFTETISVLDKQPAQLGLTPTNVFFSHTPTLQYQGAADFVNPQTGVVCIPNNYLYGNNENAKQLKEGLVRVTCIANYQKWAHLFKTNPEAYKAEKKAWFTRVQNAGLACFPGIDSSAFNAAVVEQDMFTPKTITHYTGHLGGSIYGAPNKSRTGETPYKNCFIIGTDQGFLGIVGGMLSGISMANAHGLK